MEFAVGPDLDSLSQPGPAPEMEFPLRIQQDSIGKPGSVEEGVDREDMLHCLGQPGA